MPSPSTVTYLLFAKYVVLQASAWLLLVITLPVQTFLRPTWGTTLNRFNHTTVVIETQRAS